MKRILFPLMLLALGPHTAARAEPNAIMQDLKPAQAALAAADYPRAFALFRHEADRNPLAQFTLALFYQNGWGRSRDPAAACGWFEKAAQQGVPAGEHFWGDCLAQGIGRTADITSALAWYDKAAADGHLFSQCAAADYYIQGKGVAKDVARGLGMCTRVAQANSAPAMLKLAHYYRDGRDVPQDLALARRWLQGAAELGNLEAQCDLGVMLSQGEGGDPDLNKALFWLETAASAGYAPAYLPTAILYANAPVQKDTGALAPEHLAKIYLWASAAKARGERPEVRARAAAIESQVLAVMPASWRPDLDRKVAAHLTQYPKP
ncbi:MAG TPA: tetratricopeptide repeat protein [Telluria sp.]|nr:tetratricopeptide repeat protein [Telluria sp.]